MARGVIKSNGSAVKTAEKSNDSVKIREKDVIDYIKNLNLKIKTLETEIVSLKNQLSESEKQMTEYENKIAEYENKFSAITSLISGQTN